MESTQSPTEIYSALLTLTKPQQHSNEENSKDTNLPKEVITHIYLYLHDTIIRENNTKYIEKRINNITNLNEAFTIHKNELPHPKNITIKELRKQLDKELKKKSETLKFSHYCCSGKGLVYKYYNHIYSMMIRYI